MKNHTVVIRTGQLSFSNTKIAKEKTGLQTIIALVGTRINSRGDETVRIDHVICANSIAGIDTNLIQRSLSQEIKVYEIYIICHYSIMPN